MRRAIALGMLLVGCAASAAPKAKTSWAERTLAAMSLEEKVGQLVMVRTDSTFLPTDSDEFDRLRRLVVDRHVGGVIMFGGVEPVPSVLLNAGYGSTVLGDPLDAASLVSRLQRLARQPLLVGADFEWGVGMRIKGGTTFPRAMAFGAAGDPALVERAARVTAAEMRAIGVHVNFAPVADVNNNPRNPVINTRSYGEDPARVSAMVTAAVHGLEQGGVLSVLKHYPGHGDTEVDSHVGLATVPHDRARLDAVELAPFRAGIAAGASGVMTAHLLVPAIDPAPDRPATLSTPLATGLLRDVLGFRGLVVTDSMVMQAVTRIAGTGEAAVRAFEAGNELVLDPPEPGAALDALAAAARSGRLPLERIDRAAGRILAVKERLGLPASQSIDLARVPDLVGGRASRDLARSIAERSVTAVRSASLPLALPKTGTVLHVSALDYPGNWRVSAPGRTFVSELKTRFPNTTAVEVSDRSGRGELELLRAAAPRFDAIVIAVYVRAASGSGRLNLSPEVAALLNDLGIGAGSRPVVACLFGNPYVAADLPSLGALLLTYDFGDNAELAAVRAIAGEIQMTGTLPITVTR